MIASPVYSRKDLSELTTSVLIVNSRKSAVIVTECINEHNDTNKRNNCLSLVCTLNFHLNNEYQKHFILLIN